MKRTEREIRTLYCREFPTNHLGDSVGAFMAGYALGQSDALQPSEDLEKLLSELTGYERSFMATNDAEREASYFREAERLKDQIRALFRPQETNGESTMKSVLQEWVIQLPLRFQGTLLTAVRGCDDEPKEWTSTGVSYSQGRRITAYIRWCFMNPADPREVDREEGAFFMSTPPQPFKPSQFGHLPQHWYSHVMHALEIIAYYHPTERERAFGLYMAMVHSFHLNIETKEEQFARLTEDRISKGTVVS